MDNTKRTTTNSLEHIGSTLGAIVSRLERALYTQDSHAVGVLVDHLRFAHGLTYDECYNLADEFIGISKDFWDALLYQTDMTS